MSGFTRDPDLTQEVLVAVFRKTTFVVSAGWLSCSNHAMTKPEFDSPRIASIFWSFLAMLYRPAAKF